jgi:hypothetical protein
MILFAEMVNIDPVSHEDMSHSRKPHWWFPQSEFASGCPLSRPRGTMDLEQAALHLPTVQMNVANWWIRLMAQVNQPRLRLFQGDFGRSPAERFDRNAVQSLEDDSTGGIKADRASV